jgi:hypothetical protein
MRWNRVREKYLLLIKRGVRVVGQDHLVEVQKIERIMG